MPLTRYRDRNIHWMSAGQGPGMLFIHGAGGNAAIWWQQFAHFAKTHTTVAFDLAGFGLSDAPTVSDYADQLAATAAAVLDAAGLKEAVVVSQSLGGWSGLRLALEHPARVRKLVLSCTMAGVAHPAALQAFQHSLTLMDERGPVSLALAADFAEREPAKAYLYNQVSRQNPPQADDVRRMPLSSDVLIPVEKLRAIACPVLVLAGEHDRIWPPASLRGIADALPHGSMTVIANSGHSPYFERPTDFNAAVEAFLAA